MDLLGNRMWMVAFKGQRNRQLEKKANEGLVICFQSIASLPALIVTGLPPRRKIGLALGDFGTGTGLNGQNPIWNRTLASQVIVFSSGNFVAVVIPRQVRSILLI